MTNPPPPGRRRAHERAGVRRTEPAAHADLAALWGQVSRTHQVLLGRVRYFETTTSDDRLSDHLSLLSALHERQPLSVAEVEELTYLLSLYVDPMTVREREEAAWEAAASVRKMTARRGHDVPRTEPATRRPQPPAATSPQRPVIPRQRTGDEPAPAAQQEPLVDPLAALRQMTEQPAHPPVRDRRAPRGRGREVALVVAAVVVLVVFALVLLLV